MPPLRLHRRLAAAAEGAQDQGPLQQPEQRRRADTAAQEEGEAQEAANQHILRKCDRELTLIGQLCYLCTSSPKKIELEVEGQTLDYYCVCCELFSASIADAL